MKLKFALFVPALALAVAASAALPGFAQQGTKPAAQPAEDLPDAPQATTAALTRPNGPTVVMDTSMGRITCQFFERQAPKAVANFIALAEGTKDWVDPTTKKKQHNKPLYDGTTFHRVIPEFMIQGGDPTGTGMGDPGYTFEDELDPDLNFDQPGRLAMANSGPNTNGSQFFITEQAYDTLNQHYTLFGQCDDSSVLVVKTIARVQRDSDDKPITPVVLKKVTIVREGQSLPPLPGTEPPAKKIAVSAEVAQGMLSKRTPLAYPAEAKAQGISGTVELKALIGTDGKIVNLQVMSGPPALQEAALNAVKDWEYKPYTVNGEPVQVMTTIRAIYMITGRK
ncbi:MAG: TonB family protein [Terracidiphilus sp.]|jgi:peptidyl-prolyl cis-trans isomerase A (cyclophilin A)